MAITANRRGFVSGGMAATGGLMLAAATNTAMASARHDLAGVAPAKETLPLLQLSASEVVLRLRRGELTCETYTNALLQRAAQFQNLNVFASLAPEKLLATAKRLDATKPAQPPPLWGLPIPVKDSIFTAGDPTTGGTAALAAFKPAYDAEIVTRLGAAGAFVFGKTNLHELSTGLTGNASHFGPIHNPYAVGKIAGGSSSGSAVAVATGIAPLAIGEDTAGSNRVPPALTGVVGFRPTTGRYSNRGVIPLTPTFDQVGPEARDVSDIELFDRIVTSRPTPLAAKNLRDIRLGVPRAYLFDTVDDEYRTLMEKGVQKLREAGITLVEKDIPRLKELLPRSYAAIVFTEIHTALENFLATNGLGNLSTLLAKSDPRTRVYYERFVMPGGQNIVSFEEYKRAIVLGRPALREEVQRYFSDNALDAIVFPTTKCPAFPIDADTAVINGQKISTFEALGFNTILAPTCRLPSIALPLARTAEGLPVGLSLDGPSGADERLLSVALAIEPVLKQN